MTDSVHDSDAAPDGLTTPQTREVSVRPGARAQRHTSTTSSPSGRGAPSSRRDRRSRATRRPRSSRTCARPRPRPTSRSPRRAACVRRRCAATARRRPRGLDRRQRRLVQGHDRPRRRQARHQAPAPGESDRPGDRRQGHRRRDGRPARLPLEQDPRGSTTSPPVARLALLSSHPTSSRSSAGSRSSRRDFRRWVAMHEETTGSQFTAVPWLREHLRQHRPAARRRPRAYPEDCQSRFEQARRSTSPRCRLVGEDRQALLRPPRAEGSDRRVTA